MRSMHWRVMRGLLNGLIIILMAGASLATASPARAQLIEAIIEWCTGVDHFWNPEEYPFADPNRDDLDGAPSIIIVAYTFDLMYVPPGSTMSIVWDDGVLTEGEVGPDGKAIIISGVWTYDEYRYIGAVYDPLGNMLDISFHGSVDVNANERECSKDILKDSPKLATETPPPTPTPEPDEATNTPLPEATATPLPATATDTPEATIDGGPVVAAEEGDGFDIPLFGPTPDWIVYLCCLLLLALLLGGTVIIVVRRRRRRHEALDDELGEMGTRFKF